jgi:ribosomal protein RSM22 (predicted rRNA methylase)
VSALPVPLRQAISEFCESVPGPEIARRAGRQSEQYRAGGRSMISDTADVAAYLTTRLPATFAAISAVLARVRERAPTFSPTSLLDFGAGPGTACWAAAETWAGIESIAMRDRSRIFLSAAQQLGQQSPHRALLSAGIGPSESLRNSDQYDLVIASYVIAEMSGAAAAETVTQLWNHCRGVMVIVEPGTPAGFQRVLRAREALLGRDALIVAPCPGQASCPVAAPDWCHFAVRLPRSRDHMRAKSANVPYEDEKYSYVVAAHREVELQPPSPRIIAPVVSAKAGLRFRLCTGRGISEVEIPRRDRAAYRAQARKKWGDTI